MSSQKVSSVECTYDGDPACNLPQCLAFHAKFGGCKHDRRVWPTSANLSLSDQQFFDGDDLKPEFYETTQAAE